MLALLACALASPASRAQGPDANVHFTRKRDFLIPFEPEDGRRITQVRLYVSTDEGKHYEPVASAAPSERQFRYRALDDGWYWFSVQTVDERGQANPPDVSRHPPGLKICVDTRQPRVSLSPAVPASGPAAVQWDVLDDNPDLLSLQIRYRVPGARNWVDLNVPQIARGQHDFDPGRAGRIEVHLRVADRAGNTAEADTTVTADPSAARPAAHRPGGKVLHVKNRTFQLNYKITNVGPSGVKFVKIWYTRDGNRYEVFPGKEAPATGPYMVEVPGEGRYGFTLVPYSRVGLSPPPPRPGEEPQLWVEVDETPPNVSLRQVIVGRGPDTGKLTISWTAKDLFLTPQPISITYSESPSGPWRDLLLNVANTGMVTCDSHKLPYEFYLRVEAVDEAGNKGYDQTSEKVKVDLQIPQIESVGITPGRGK
jgi:hypothetical protein